MAYNVVTPAQYRAFGFPGADDLGNMFQFYTEFEAHYNKTRDLALSKELNPNLLSFEAWLDKYGKSIPLD